MSKSKSKKSKKLKSQVELQATATRAALETVFGALRSSGAAGAHGGNVKAQKRRRRQDAKREARFAGC